MELYSALGIVPGDVVAFAGAGGKSGAILGIAGELARTDTKVLVVPTTKMFLEEAERVGPLVTSGDPDELHALVEEALAGNALAGGAVAAGSGLLSKGRVAGVEPGWVASLAPLADVTLVEADGARRRPIKGTADHEPVLPGVATLVVAVGNVGALGTPVDEEHVHRPDLFSELTGVGPGHSITADALAKALALGSLGRVPAGVRRAALLTGVGPGRRMSEASVVAHELWRLDVRKVVLSSLPNENPASVWAL